MASKQVSIPPLGAAGTFEWELLTQAESATLDVKVEEYRSMGESIIDTTFNPNIVKNLPFYEDEQITTILDQGDPGDLLFVRHSETAPSDVKGIRHLQGKGEQTRCQLSFTHRFGHS